MTTLSLPHHYTHELLLECRTWGTDSRDCKTFWVGSRRSCEVSSCKWHDLILFSLCHVQLKKALRDQILTICSTCLYTLNNSLPSPHELAT